MRKIKISSVFQGILWTALSVIAFVMFVISFLAILGGDGDKGFADLF